MKTRNSRINQYIQYKNLRRLVIARLEELLAPARMRFSEGSRTGKLCYSSDISSYMGGTSQISDLTVCTALCQITDLTCSAAAFTVPALSRLCEATSLPAGPGSAAILDPGLEQGGSLLFLDSPEWDSLRPSEEGVFQVTLTAETRCKYITWRRKKLYLLFAKHRFISRIFSMLIRGDIANKLYALNEKVYVDSGFRFDIRLPNYYHMASPDQSHSSAPTIHVHDFSTKKKSRKGTITNHSSTF
ncbi:unnamed protein product [Ranitomeya imitator]|uniref:Popeye domain-containing protein 3 n=1 Tax=Ranitomeya imitator TaxID=111125 RepID=A0ABN9M2I2_9NEOB|nr:unnamed protein product [Ranitomeya imitator]